MKLCVAKHKSISFAGAMYSKKKSCKIVCQKNVKRHIKTVTLKAFVNNWKNMWKKQVFICKYAYK